MYVDKWMLLAERKVSAQTTYTSLLSKTQEYKSQMSKFTGATGYGNTAVSTLSASCLHLQTVQTNVWRLV